MYLGMCALVVYKQHTKLDMCHCTFPFNSIPAVYLRNRGDFLMVWGGGLKGHNTKVFRGISLVMW